MTAVGRGTAGPATDITGRYRTTTVVAWDELDALGVLHHARFVVHAERAFSRLLDAMGYAYHCDPAVRPERHHVVAAVRLAFRRPVEGPGPLDIEQRVEHLGCTSLAMAFTVTAAGTGATVAEGTRTVVHVDWGTRRPQPWSPEFRQRLHTLFSEHDLEARP
ncbi:acyl-CoA thioesterase [Streptomyces sp. NPDC086080]|uniref:acyl-CoA thioesterase n=1 Tax=Streptomyces sp. NPDC086080 TaxID=3365748 RepID=UPI0037D4488C